MGVVYEAEQLSLSRRVAVKVLPFASLWPESVLERFRQEVRIAASLEHPHMLQIYGYGCEHGVHFYSMKLVDGGSLADVIRQRNSLGSTTHSAPPITTQRDSLQPTPGLVEDTITTRRVSDDATPGLTDDIIPTELHNEEAGTAFTFASSYESWAMLTLAAAEALAFAHQRGVIHRDIKPSNLLLDRQGKLFVADFGLARDETDINLTRTGELLGTPRYMSPEQAAGSPRVVDARTDIYSLGATLYELITLQPVIRAVNRAAALANCTTCKSSRRVSTMPIFRHRWNRSCSSACSPIRRIAIARRMNWPTTCGDFWMAAPSWPVRQVGPPRIAHLSMRIRDRR